MSRRQYRVHSRPRQEKIHMLFRVNLTVAIFSAIPERTRVALLQEEVIREHPHMPCGARVWRQCHPRRTLKGCGVAPWTGASEWQVFLFIALAGHLEDDVPVIGEGCS